MSLLISLPGEPWWLLILGIAGVVLWLKALVEALTSEFRDGMTKLIWVLVILFASFLGALLWFAVGKGQTIKSRRAY